jgi:hypothetical protein
MHATIEPQWHTAQIRDLHGHIGKDCRGASGACRSHVANSPTTINKVWLPEDKLLIQKSNILGEFVWISCRMRAWQGGICEAQLKADNFRQCSTGGNEQ